MTQPPDHAHDVNLDECRTAFESYLKKHAVSNDKEPGPWGDAQYVHSHVEAGWHAWQAAWSARTPAITGSAGQAVDVEALKHEKHNALKNLPHMNNVDASCASGFMYGWNDCIDHLAERGLFTGAGLTADAVEQVREALDYADKLAAFADTLLSFNSVQAKFAVQCALLDYRQSRSILPPSKQQQSTGKGVEG